MGIFDRFIKTGHSFSRVDDSKSDSGGFERIDTLDFPEDDDLVIAARGRRKRQPMQSTLNHKVSVGDTLYKIARRYYGRGTRWREIYRANADLVDDPDQLRPGQILQIPMIDINPSLG